MDVSSSRVTLLADLLFIAAPLSLLLLLGMGVFIPSAISHADLLQRVFALLLVVDFCAVVSGWMLAVSFPRDLRRCSWWWWVLAGSGGVVALAALIAKYAPASEAHSPVGVFRQEIDMLVLGLPLLIPLFHLALERRRIGA